MKHVIIGGVAGGATAAARIRRADEFAEIILIERGKYISYANCGLPYYIGGIITDRERLFVQTPASFSKMFNIDVRVENEVISVDTKAKNLSVRRSDNSVYVESYDKLLFSTGASPVRPLLEGIDSEGIFTLRNVEDTDKIKDYIASHEVKKAVVVGAGFIGLEMAENLYHADVEVSIVEMDKQVMSPIDFSMASLVHQHLLQKGVHLHLGKGVEKFKQHDNELTVFYGGGEQLEADLVILSIGVRPETALAKAAGLKIGEARGIWIDEYLQTSVKDVYAVGDAVEFPNPLTGKPWLNYLANPANRQGRIVADNMVFGNTTKYEGAIGTAIAKVFDMTVASTGLAAKKLKALSMKYCSSVTHSSSHAGYYPGAMPLTIKLTFDPDNGKLYGAQCVGYDGVDKRIDEISLLIKKGGTVYDLTKLEHTYAPPFSSAKDPIAIAGYAACNILNGSMPIISWRDMQSVDRSKIMILDVRTRDEFSLAAIPGAINIPVEEIRERHAEIPTDKQIYVYCAVGLRGYLAQKILIPRGYKNIKNLSGGYRIYAAAIAPVVETAPKLVPLYAPHIDLDTQRVETVSTKGEKKMIKVIKIDACGLSCPGPIMKVKQAIDQINQGECLEIVSTDAGFTRDASSWCDTTGNIFISKNENKGRFTVIIEKGGPKTCKTVTSCDPKAKTLIMFSDDLDKALATFVLANAAAATGEKVTIFFTFWGLNVIKKTKKPKVKKDIFGKMFSYMLPSDSLKLHLSKMSMFGIGDKMMRHIMKSKGIESLESLRAQALASHVEFIACQMSMDVMGVKKEELLDEVTIGGAATYINRAESANMNLFI